jgi:hypothetical protein
VQEADTLDHNYIGTEHLLLGLVRENGGVAARVLFDLDADGEQIRDEVLRALGSEPARSRHYIHPALTARGPKNGVRPRGRGNAVRERHDWPAVAPSTQFDSALRRGRVLLIPGFRTNSLSSGGDH